MKWIINTKENTKIELSETELLDLLFNRLLQDSKKEDREDFDSIIKVFSDYMQEQKAIMSMPMENLLSMSMAIGYFYRILLEKNEVEKIKEKNENSV